jgi:dTDP-4-amino-4,6-dideoxygalactose transaminase
MPRAPVFGWASFAGPRAADVHCVDALPHRVLTSSGRAAIYQALCQLQLPPGSAVLVPTYHCPTMVAPVVQAGLRPLFFGIDVHGLPDLAGIENSGGVHARAMLVAHYFGMARSLAAVRAFCDRNGIVLIEDCAHCLFGDAGERPVGAWGDFAIASLTKFFPVPEAGLLASGTRAVALSLALTPAAAVAQIKGIIDTLENACRFERLHGLNAVLRAAFALKRLCVRRNTPPSAVVEGGQGSGGCDMSRVAQAPLGIARCLTRMLPRGRIVSRRRANYERYAILLSGFSGARPLVPPAQERGANVAPYVFPLWVEDADRVYHALRERGAAVLRWDRLWEGTPNLAGDAGIEWSKHVLQFLCHQDLGARDIAATAAATRALLEHQAAV